MDIVFIDLDGTLEDSRKDMALAINRVRLKHKLPELPTDHLQQFVNMGMDKLCINGFPELLNSNDFHKNHDRNDKQELLDSLAADFTSEYSDKITLHTKVYDGIFELLEKIKNKFQLVCITNKPEYLALKLMDSLFLSHYFDLVLGGDSCANSKPSAIPLQEAVKRLDYVSQPNKTWMIGDGPGDIEAGLAFGSKTIWCAWGYYKSSQKTSKADFMAKKPLDLITILNLE